MKIYCDGSYHDKYGVTGIGVINGDDIIYKEFSDSKRNNHEIEALICAIESGLNYDNKSFTVINDDVCLVRVLNRIKDGENMDSSSLNRNVRFNFLSNLIINNDVNIITPMSYYDNKMIKKCHDLSRSYMMKDEFRRHRKALNINTNYKVPDKLYIGHIQHDNITIKEKQAMNLFYCALTGYDNKYSIDDILKWIEDKPSINTKNGRKHVVKQFFNNFHK